MAGDWMKIELELPDKPEVHAIASTLNLDPDSVVGKLIRVWQWFDKHTTDGNAYGVTYSLPDRITGVTGFGEAMMFVGWLEQNDKTLTMPKFDRHTSQSAKKRALTNKRVSKSRAYEKEERNAISNAESVTKTLPEKRREENIYISKGTRLSRDWILPPDWVVEAQNINSLLTLKDIHNIADGFKDYWIGLSGSKGVKLDWLATWRNWIRNQKIDKQPPKQRDWEATAL